MTEWYTVMELEKETGIADSTIRRYIRNHGHHLQIKKRGKSYLIAKDSIPIIKNIRELYDKGKQLGDVDETLRKMNVPVTITVTEDEKEVTINASEVLMQLQKDMEEQKKFNQLLLERLNEQNKYINNSLEERDKRLIEALKESMEARKQIAVNQEEIEKNNKRKWYQFWK